MGFISLSCSTIFGFGVVFYFRIRTGAWFGFDESLERGGFNLAAAATRNLRVGSTAGRSRQDAAIIQE